jgi:NADH-quinone oxidoreductase subunit F
MVDQEIVIQHPRVIENKENEEKKIAIIGGGPAGLSCGYFLARLGYKPEVFEAEQRPGGMLVQTIPAYRLPRETLAREIRMIEQLGVRIHTNAALGRDFSLQDLRDQGYDAVFLGVGAPGGLSLSIPGEDARGVIEANAFLREYNIRGSAPVGRNVVVVGGGNAAIDAARTALRLGAETVTVVYRRSQEQMPAYAEEIAEALHEGVTLRCLAQPVKVIADENGAVKGLHCSRMALGAFDRSGRRRATNVGEAPIVLETDQVIVAIGQRLDVEQVLGTVKIELAENGFVKADPLTGRTSQEWLFAGGDAASGPASVVAAIAAGERAAVGIDLMLTGEDHAFWREERVPDTAFDPEADPVTFAREAMPTVAVERRRRSFEEVELPWDERIALQQCQRCLRCDYGKTSVRWEVRYA